MTKPKQVLKPRVQTASKSVNNKELKSKLSIGKRLPLLVLALFAIAGAFVGGYVLLKSNATSDCSGAPTADGYNACLTTFYVPNLHPSNDCDLSAYKTSSASGSYVSLQDDVNWMKDKFRGNIFINEPTRNYLATNVSTRVSVDPSYSELGCGGYTDQGVVVVQIQNTGTAAWKVGSGKGVCDPTATHLQSSNPYFHSIDTITDGAFCLQYYANKGKMPDPDAQGTQLGTYTASNSNNLGSSTELKSDPTGDTGTVWVAIPVSYGQTFTTNGSYDVSFQMINDAGVAFGNKAVLTVNARGGGVFPSKFSNFTNVCILQVQGKTDPANPKVIANFVVPVTGADKPSCTQAQYDDSGFNPAKPKSTVTAPKIKPAPQKTWAE